MTEDQIKHMVDRFLGWRLPEKFSPDNGIGFNPIAGEGGPHPFKREPVGTNLFDAQQTTEMVRHMVDGLPGPSEPIAQGQREAISEECLHPNLHFGSGDYHLFCHNCHQTCILAALAPSAQEGETVTEWIAYADKLEKVIALCAKSSVDNLTRLHAENGLRVVSHSRPHRGGGDV